MKALLCLTLITASTTAAAIEIALRPSVSIGSGEVRVGDVADLTGAAPAELTWASELTICRAPQPGFAIVLARADIRRRFRRYLEESTTHWTGASEVVVRTESQVVAGKAIERAAMEHLAERFPPHTEVRVEVKGVVPDTQVAVGEVSLRVSDGLGLQPERRMQTARVDILVEGNVVRTVPVRMAVESSQTAWVATRPVRRGQAFSCGSFASRTTTVPGFSSGFPEACDEHTAVLARDVLPGEAITAEHIRKRPTVEQGDRVHVRYIDGGVIVDMQAMAISHANYGDYVQVSVPQLKSPLVPLLVTETHRRP